MRTEHDAQRTRASAVVLSRQSDSSHLCIKHIINTYIHMPTSRHVCRDTNCTQPDNGPPVTVGRPEKFSAVDWL